MQKLWNPTCTKATYNVFHIGRVAVLILASAPNGGQKSYHWGRVGQPVWPSSGCWPGGAGLSSWSCADEPPPWLCGPSHWPLRQNTPSGEREREEQTHRYHINKRFITRSSKLLLLPINSQCASHPNYAHIVIWGAPTENFSHIPPTSHRDNIVSIWREVTAEMMWL